MKRHFFINSLFSIILFCTAANAQNTVELRPIYSYLTVDLSETDTWCDIGDIVHINSGTNVAFNPMWIDQYISLEVSGTIDGKETSSVTRGPVLSAEQMDIIKHTPNPSASKITLHYMPQNDLSSNQVQKITFNVTIAPLENARFSEGSDQLLSSIKELIEPKVEEEHFTGYELSVVTFTIDEEGQLHSAEVFQPALQDEQHQQFDQLLLDAMLQNASWIPAINQQGEKISQKWMVTFGNAENCKTHLIP